MSDAGPGQAVQVAVDAAAPASHGDYGLEVSMVAERVLIGSMVKEWLRLSFPVYLPHSSTALPIASHPQ